MEGPLEDPMEGLGDSPGDGSGDDFYERFSAELEVLAEMEDYPSPPAGPKISQFRSRRQPLEETEPAGGGNPKKRSQECALRGSPQLSPAPEPPVTLSRFR
ncbi:Chromosome transmission fidelity protein 18-like protein isoform X1 [Aix galericulata]|nr:Chromosome transmission fidelity protein 18-like protein isoform X1 [Aix galericulata]